MSIKKKHKAQRSIRLTLQVKESHSFQCYYNSDLNAAGQWTGVWPSVRTLAVCHQCDNPRESDQKEHRFPPEKRKNTPL